ncbi:MAG: hypothetical protein OES32_11280 [Acidobacteriota bacterium]|nr:hypothetical protein [Acidobacteriota bacterium]
MTSKPDSGPWWSEREVAIGRGLRWTLGPLDLAVSRLEHEWQIAYGGTGDSDADRDVALAEPISELPERAEVLERYAAGGQRSVVRCLPALADRSVVVRPRVPIFIPPGERIRFFVSSPIWLEIEVGIPWQALREVAVKRQSDTWFGSATGDGELAYTLRTHARVDLGEIPLRHHRAITPVTIENEGEDTLAIDRLNLPVPFLSVYAAGGDYLWTQDVTMLRREGQTMASFEIGEEAPREAPGAERLTAPRRTAEGLQIVRAFANLLQGLAPGGDG